METAIGSREPTRLVLGVVEIFQCSCQCDRDRVQSQGKEVKDKDPNKEGKAEPEAK